MRSKKKWLKVTVEASVSGGCLRETIMQWCAPEVRRLDEVMVSGEEGGNVAWLVKGGDGRVRFARVDGVVDRARRAT